MATSVASAVASAMQVDEPVDSSSSPVDNKPSSLSSSGRREVLNPNLDLDIYIASYKGHTKVNRLQFIAEVCPPLRIEALRSALVEIKKTQDYTRYSFLLMKLNDTLVKTGNALEPADQDWIETTKKQARIRNDKLEAELNNYKQNLIKESIRMGYNDLGDHYYDCGDLHNALKNYSRTKDYCTMSKHIVSMCLNGIKVAIELQNDVHVQTFALKAESAPEIADKEIVMSKIKCALGLANLKMGKYKSAARSFLEVSPALQNEYNEVLSAQDIATYGGLCALATFDRRELKTKVMDSPSFRLYLELAPEIREMIHDFYNSRYKSCLNHLESLKPDLLLDMYLNEHLASLYAEIRKKSLVQYFSPFSSVDLSKMAAGFNTNVNDLEHEIAKLIMSDAIKARIDSHSKVLYARQANERVNTFENALESGNQYARNIKALQLHIRLLRAEISVKS